MAADNHPDNSHDGSQVRVGNIQNMQHIQKLQKIHNINYVIYIYYKKYLCVFELFERVDVRFLFMRISHIL